MATIEQRVSMIEQSVLAQAQQQCDGIHKQADDYKQKEIDKMENQILGELYTRIQSEVSHIHSSSTSDISQQEATQRQTLLRRREELTQTIFGEVRQKLLAYLATDDYREGLLKTAASIAKDHPLEGSDVTVGPNDGALLLQLEEIFGEGCHVATDPSIKLGGLRLHNRKTGIFIDETLDSKLEEQRPWFYLHSGLTLG